MPSLQGHRKGWCQVTTFRAGDVVYHRPTGEEWVLAYAEGKRVSPCGWPETIAEAAHCELRKACPDEEHLKMLHEWADEPKRCDIDGSMDYRSCVCRRQLAAKEPTR